MIDLHIRIPDELAEKIKAQAEENRRSINSEIIILLEIVTKMEQWVHAANAPALKKKVGIIDRVIEAILSGKEPAVREQTQAVKREEPPNEL
jgi:hypothetical protein